jgi:RNA polymerase sigma factor (sigma-70 family)
MEDPQLLADFLASGSEAAFATLVARHSSLVYSAALRQVRGNAHLARDVTQAVFTDLARKATHLSGRADLTGWLYTSTHYAAVQALRSESRRLRRETEAHQMSELSSAENEVAWEHVRPILDEVMRELDERDRESILWRYFEGQPYAEIGRRLSIADNAARMRVERALGRLHMLLSRRGVTSSAAALGTVLAQKAVTAAAPEFVQQIAHTAVTAIAPAGQGLVSTIFAAKTYLLAATAIAVVCGGIIIYELHNRNEAEAEVAQQRAENAATAGLINSYETKLSQEAKRAEATRRFLAISANLLTEESTTEAPAELRRLILRTRAGVASEYAHLFPKLNLTVADRKQLEILLVRKTVNEIIALHDLTASASDAADSAGVVAVVVAAVDADVDGQIASLLGPHGFKVYVEYARSLVPRRQIEEVAAAARFSERPLEDTQVEHLVELVASSDEDGEHPIPDTIVQAAGLAAPEREALVRLQALRSARRMIVQANEAAAAHGVVKLLPVNASMLEGL